MKTIIPYPGGKSYMASWIVEQFPEHSCYVEPFGGGASIIANKPPSSVEVYNDKDGDLVHFFRVLRDSPYELIRWVKSHPYHKDLHEKFGKAYYSGYRPDDDVERAGRFLYLRYSQYAGKYKTHSGFISAKDSTYNVPLKRAARRVGEFSDRFQNVTIENRDWRIIFERFDSPDTLFYCDPPYMKEGGSLYTNDGFDHNEFASRLSKLKGKWLVSYTDVPKGLKDYNVISQDRVQQMSKGKSGVEKDSRTENLIMNYNPNETTMFRDNNQSGLEAYSD